MQDYATPELKTQYIVAFNSAVTKKKFNIITANGTCKPLTSKQLKELEAMQIDPNLWMQAECFKLARSQVSVMQDLMVKNLKHYYKVHEPKMPVQIAPIAFGGLSTMSTSYNSPAPRKTPAIQVASVMKAPAQYQ